MGGHGSFDNYKFLRVIKNLKIPNQEPYEIKEYYKSGKLAMAGSIIPSKNDKRLGSFNYFFENGIKKSIELYDEGLLKSKYDFYEKGQKKMVSEYSFNIKQLTNEKKITQFWDEDGTQKVIDGNGFLENTEEGESEKGEIKEGLKEGIWEGKQDKFSYKEKYKNGILLSGVSVDEFSELHSYNELLIMPVPKKGIKDFYEYIGQNMFVPEGSIGGKIVIAFLVDKNGKIIKTKIEKDIGYEGGKEAIKVLLKYGNWQPGIHRGRNVRCHFTLPISIQSSN